MGARILALDMYEHAYHGDVGAAAGAYVDAFMGNIDWAGVFEQASTTIPGARWCDPAAVARWSAELPATQELVVYCVYGHEVSRATAMRLRAMGLNARFLRGGIDGWQTAGRPLADKPLDPTP